MRQGFVWSAIALGLVGCAVTEDDSTDTISQDSSVNGKKLFERETFGGNGRTCVTCHDKNGTLTPEDAQHLFAHHPTNELFRSIDSDDGAGTSYTKLLADATIRVTIPLPANWRLADDPTARSVTFRRAIPTTNNVPSLDTIFMADGRFATLEDQALGAVNAHYQPGILPTAAQLAAIADFEQTNKFFSSNDLKHYADGGPAPTLPPGHTAAEKRGRLFFVPSATGICGHCHAGPMLNQTSEFLQAPFPPGTRFFTAFVSELNKAGNQVRTFIVTNPDATETTIQSPDPGRALITGNPGDANFFRIPTLWGAADTGPWFHDNSAKTLAQLAQHYSDYFLIVIGHGLTAQEQSDIVAYLKLLK